MVRQTQPTPPTPCSQVSPRVYSLQARPRRSCMCMLQALRLTSRACTCQDKHHLVSAVCAGIGRRSVKVSQGRAVKGVPLLHTNLSELQDPDHAREDTALIQAITEPPAFYAPNLDRHNAYRAQHTSTPPLAWDDAVADSAAAYASRCIWGHDPNNKYGVSCLTRVRQSDSCVGAVPFHLCCGDNPSTVLCCAHIAAAGEPVCLFFGQRQGCIPDGWPEGMVRSTAATQTSACSQDRFHLNSSCSTALHAACCSRCSTRSLACL